MDIRLAFSESESVGRCEVASLRLTSDEEGYNDGAVVPHGHWQPLTREDAKCLQASDATPDSVRIELIRRPLPPFATNDEAGRLETAARLDSLPGGWPTELLGCTTPAPRTRPPPRRTPPTASASACTSTTSTGCRTSCGKRDADGSASTSAPARATSWSPTGTSNSSAGPLAPTFSATTPTPRTSVGTSPTATRCAACVSASERARAISRRPSFCRTTAPPVVSSSRLSPPSGWDGHRVSISELHRGQGRCETSRCAKEPAGKDALLVESIGSKAISTAHGGTVVIREGSRPLSWLELAVCRTCGGIHRSHRRRWCADVRRATVLW